MVFGDFKMTTYILGMLWLTVILRWVAAIDGATGDHQKLPFDASRFLSLLGLDGRPMPDQDVVIPDYMLGLYRQSSERSMIPGVAVRSIKLEEVDSANASSCDQSSFRYDLSSLNHDEKLVQATVRLTNVFGPNDRPSLVLTSGHGGPSTRVRPLARRWSHRRDVVFAVTEAVGHCRALHLGNVRGKCSIVLEVTSERRPEGLDAILVVVTRRRQVMPQLSRVTRAAVNRKSLSERLCQRKEMYVDFRKIGWSNWIIAPSGYSAYYCAGSCPFPISEHLNTTNHAIIQTLAHSVDPHRVASTCCVPTHFAPISMLYYDTNNNVVLKQYDDMIVDACGCR